MSGLQIDFIPKKEHFTIITEFSYSEDNGYGDHSTRVALSYEAFIDRKKWEDRVSDLALTNKRYFAAIVKPAEISVSVEVKVV